MNEVPVIRLVGEDTSAAPSPSAVVFVGGPLDGIRRELPDAPGSIAAPGGMYRQSVHCADDGALRFVYEATQGTAEPK
jgi:hypothetical protein